MYGTPSNSPTCTTLLCDKLPSHSIPSHPSSNTAQYKVQVFYTHTLSAAYWGLRAVGYSSLGGAPAALPQRGAALPALSGPAQGSVTEPG